MKVFLKLLLTGLLYICVCFGLGCKVSADKKEDVQENQGSQGNNENVETGDDNSSEDNSETPSVTEYTITYHVMAIGETTIEKDYLGSWVGFFGGEYDSLKALQLPKKYQEGDAVVIPSLPVGEEFELLGVVRGTFSVWYTDETCTNVFSGKLEEGSTGDVHLYTCWTTTVLGPL